jgi:tetratricopeptide (TPR) repeat protein
MGEKPVLQVGVIRDLCSWVALKTQVCEYAERWHPISPLAWAVPTTCKRWMAYFISSRGIIVRQHRVILLLLSALAGAPGFCDTLILQDGRRLTGEVSQNEAGNYVVKTRAGQITFPAAEVSKWEKGATDAAAAKPLLGTTAAPSEPKADPAAVTARAAKIVDQANAALLAGDAKAALEGFQDAKSLWDRQRVRMDSTNPVQLACLQGLGICYMALSRYDKAIEPLERAYLSPQRGRSLILNRAIVDLVQKTNIARGIKEVKDLLARETAPDEIALNVLGASLGHSGMDEHFSQTAYFQGVAAFYDAKNKELEATRSGDARWGTEWLSREMVRRKLAQLADEQAKYQTAVADARNAEGLVSAAHSNIDGMVTTGLSPARAYADLDRAKQMLSSATAHQHEAWKNMPRPDWPKTFSPVLPEALGGYVFGTPAPVAVAVVTPAPAVPGRPSSPVRPTVTASDPPRTTTVSPPPVIKSTRRSVQRSAVAVPVAPDLVLTSAAPVENAVEFMLETATGSSFKAELVRKDPATGLALLRVAGQRFTHLNLATSFAGGEVMCWGFPNVAIFSPVPESFPALTAAPKSTGWIIAMSRHPRLAGAAILDKTGKLVGLALGERDTLASQIPAATLEQIRAFLGGDAPKALCANPDPAAIMQLTASHESQ